LRRHKWSRRIGVVALAALVIVVLRYRVELAYVLNTLRWVQHLVATDAASRSTTPVAELLDMAPDHQLGGSSLAVAVDGRTAYVGSGARVLVVDLADLTAPKLVGTSVGLSNLVHDLAVAGDRLYVANGPGGLRVLDISVRAHPSEQFAVPEVGDTRAVGVGDGVVWVGTNGDRVGLAAVADDGADRPRVVGRYFEPETAACGENRVGALLPD